MRRLSLTVLTPARTLLNVENVAWVKVQLADGSGISIWSGHAPLLAETMAAPLHYADEEGQHRLDLEAGILKIERGGITIFTPGALPAEVAADQSPGKDDQDIRFDRLARALLAALGAQPEKTDGEPDQERAGRPEAALQDGP